MRGKGLSIITRTFESAEASDSNVEFTDILRSQFSFIRSSENVIDQTTFTCFSRLKKKVVGL